MANQISVTPSPDGLLLRFLFIILAHQNPRKQHAIVVLHNQYAQNTISKLDMQTRLKRKLTRDQLKQALKALRVVVYHINRDEQLRAAYENKTLTFRDTFSRIVSGS